jgi:hypothetical protein
LGKFIIVLPTLSVFDGSPDIVTCRYVTSCAWKRIAAFARVDVLPVPAGKKKNRIDADMIWNDMI